MEAGAPERVFGPCTLGGFPSLHYGKQTTPGPGLALGMVSPVPSQCFFLDLDGFLKCVRIGAGCNLEVWVPAGLSSLELGPVNCGQRGLPELWVLSHPQGRWSRSARAPLACAATWKPWAVSWGSHFAFLAPPLPRAERLRTTAPCRLSGFG